MSKAWKVSCTALRLTVPFLSARRMCSIALPSSSVTSSVSSTRSSPFECVNIAMNSFLSRRPSLLESSSPSVSSMIFSITALSTREPAPGTCRSISRIDASTSSLRSMWFDPSLSNSAKHSSMVSGWMYRVPSASRTSSRHSDSSSTSPGVCIRTLPSFLGSAGARPPPAPPPAPPSAAMATAAGDSLQPSTLAATHGATFGRPARGAGGSERVDRTTG
mmetsp:Transcript_4727/g.17131  ORF Transcript_4727/g.17131 Transcript_4727/m.17131 type:complete len:219 (+) Transcript_4727:63-719(+)